VIIVERDKTGLCYQ